jgi:hypothetical protein
MLATPRTVWAGLGRLIALFFMKGAMQRGEPPPLLVMTSDPTHLPYPGGYGWQRGFPPIFFQSFLCDVPMVPWSSGLGAYSLLDLATPGFLAPVCFARPGAALVLRSRLCGASARDRYNLLCKTEHAHLVWL